MRDAFSDDTEYQEAYQRYLRLAELVAECMTHNECGPNQPNAVCMEDGVCTKASQKTFATPQCTTSVRSIRSTAAVRLPVAAPPFLQGSCDRQLVGRAVLALPAAQVRCASRLAEDSEYTPL